MIKWYEVGGSVRDSIMGRASADKDYAVEAGSYAEMQQWLVDQGADIFVETPEFFTIKARLPAYGACDFVLCRKDGAYRDGRRPETVEAGTIYDDLARRDFTCNAIARDGFTGEFIDPYNGRSDIEQKILRTVGNPLDRFNEDRLRILRLYRFHHVLKFHINSSAGVAVRTINDVGPGQVFKGVSADRVNAELGKIAKVDGALLKMISGADTSRWFFEFLKMGVRIVPTMKAV